MSEPTLEELFLMPVIQSPGRSGGNTARSDWTRLKDRVGYIYIYLPADHRWTKTQRVAKGINRVISEHRYVMQRVLGRELIKGENVHHKNGVKTDNRPQNLELWKVQQPRGQREPEQAHCVTCRCTEAAQNAPEVLVDAQIAEGLQSASEALAERELSKPGPY